MTVTKYRVQYGTRNSTIWATSECCALYDFNDINLAHDGLNHDAEKYRGLKYRVIEVEMPS